MNSRFVILLLACTVIVHDAWGQSIYRIGAILGTAKVQRSQKHSWEPLTLGDEVHDDDIVETFFQTKVILQYGDDNSIVLGSNSKVLLNIREAGDPSEKDELSVTLFSGGALSKTAGNARIGVYTSNAVGHIDSGTISTVVEGKTGHTGFQSLGGTASVRNIAQQDAATLTSGLTTIILPGRKPTAPLYITYRHVAVLKSFFGEDYVNREIELAGINPTDDQASSRLSLSQSLGPGGPGEMGIYKKQFSLNRIYGSILRDRARGAKHFIPIDKPRRPFDNRGEVDFRTAFALACGTVYPAFYLSSSYHASQFEAGLRLPLARNATGGMSMNWATAGGVFDKIEYLTIGDIDNGRYFRLSPIKDYTLASGLVVNNYDNKPIHSVVQPLGITGRYRRDLFDINLFISDITSWIIGGGYAEFTPANAWMGAGYYFDGNQYHPLVSSKTSRFVQLDTVEAAGSNQAPNKSQVKANSHIYEVSLGMAYDIAENAAVEFQFEFARKLAKGGADGWVLRPTIGVQMRNYHFGLGYVAESGRLLAGHFGSMYPTNRLMVDSVYEDNDSLFVTPQNNQLSTERRAYGIHAFFKMMPIRGTSLTLTLRQDFLGRKVFPENFYPDSGYVGASGNNKNFDFELRAAMNEKFWAPIKYAAIYMRQVHGGYYPRGAAYFAGWGYGMGYEILTKPFFANLAFETGLDFAYLDLYDSNGEIAFNNNIDRNDYVVEFYLGVRWGFR